MPWYLPGVFGARGAVPHAHRARNASPNQDKNDIKRADLALSAEPRELIPSTNTVLVTLGAVTLVIIKVVRRLDREATVSWGIGTYR